MSFVKRVLKTTFSLGTGQFGTTGEDTAALSGLRTSARIIKAGPPAMSTLQLDVYGMKLDMMNQLSTLGMVVQLQRRNTVMIEAGDEGGQLTKVFQGTIYNAWMDAQGTPETVFRVEAQAGLFEAVAAQDPSSYPSDAVSVADIMKTLAGKTTPPLTFENNGVTTMLPSTYLYGSPRQQMQQAGDAAKIEWVIDNGTLAIWPKNQHRAGDPVEIPVSDRNGYPTYTSSGIRIVTLFNPAVTFGGQFKITSILKPATNTWTIFRVDHDLEGHLPGGRWFSTIDGFNPAYPQPIAL